MPTAAPIRNPDTRPSSSHQSSYAVQSALTDRLIVTPERVLAVDFKSNRVVPDRPEDTPEGLLRQMGAYAAALKQVYPDRQVDIALLWTRDARLMEVPCDLAMAAMRRAAP